MTYYWESKREPNETPLANRQFEANSDEEALAKAKSEVKGLSVLYRESDNKDGLPFVVLYPK